MLDNADPQFNTPGSHIESALPAILRATEFMRKVGAKVMDVEIDLDQSEISALSANYFALLACEFKDDMPIYLEELTKSPIRSIEEMIQWNKDHHVGTHNFSSIDDADYILGARITTQFALTAVSHRRRLKSRQRL